MQTKVSRIDTGISRMMSEGTATAVNAPAAPLTSAFSRAVVTIWRSWLGMIAPANNPSTPNNRLLEMMPKITAPVLWRRASGAGTTGTIGRTGTAGSSGMAGNSGIAGMVGNAGMAGSSGMPGTTGS